MFGALGAFNISGHNFYMGTQNGSKLVHDNQVTSQPEIPSIKADPPSHVTGASPVGGASPDAARKANFVPERITLKQVKESRCYNPTTVATGLVNTVTDLVDKRVNFGPKKTTDDAPPTPSTSDSDEDFEVHNTTTIV